MKYVTCVLSMRSMTHAQQAVRVLSDENIPSSVVSLDGKLTAKGCALGVSFPCCLRSQVSSALGRVGLDYGEFVTK